MCRNRIENCTFVKTILMISIILYHSCVFWTGTWWDTAPLLSSENLGLFATWLNSFHVYAFTLVSGYIFAYKVNQGAYESYLHFLQKKAIRLLVPYLFVASVWVAPISAYFFNWDLGYVTKKYLLAINPSQLWFLWMLFIVFAIVWPIRNKLLLKPKTGWVIMFIFYGAGIIGKRTIPNVFCIWTACQYLPLFFVGMRIRVKEEQQKKLVTEAIPCYCWIMLDLLLFIGVFAIRHMSGEVWSVMATGLNFVLHIVGAIMAWTMLQSLGNIVKWKRSEAFKTLSLYSMPMYLFHQQVIYFTIVWLNGKVNPWINAGVNFVVSILVSFFISSILMRWKTTRFLIGEK